MQPVMRYLKTNWLLLATHIGALLPLAFLIWGYATNQLSVNPIQEITFRTGKYALILLVLSLACTPINTVFGFKQVIPLRRWLGLYAFFYVCLHLLTFVGLDYGFAFDLIMQEIAEKRYVLVGLAAFLLLLPLAITSTRGWMRRLGKNWKRLHRVVYAAALLAVLHYTWVVKSDVREPLIYGGIIILLLVLRIPRVRRGISTWRQRRKEQRKRVATT